MNEGIDTGPNVLKINDEGVYLFKHGLGGSSGLAIEAKDGYVENRVDETLGRDHVVLLFSKKTVLRAKQRLELSRKVTVDQHVAGLKSSIGTGGVCKESKTVASEHSRRGGDKPLNAGLHGCHV